MQTLIIHPEDKSTDFLCPIYEGIKNKEVIRGGISKRELLRVVNAHQRVMMMGHGSPLGLFAVGQFEDERYMSNIIDSTFVNSLKNKDNVFIWCHANQFVQQHQLNGFYSGMFISEVEEAILYGYEVDSKIIEESNQAFSKITSYHIHQSSKILYSQITAEYGILADNNPIAKYNHERLGYNSNIKSIGSP